jgi:ABC-type multidrug transport system ATPase subunit
MTEAQTLCGRVLVMNRGCLVAAGTPAELMAEHHAQNLTEVVMALAGGGDLP